MKKYKKLLLGLVGLVFLFQSLFLLFPIRNAEAAPNASEAQAATFRFESPNRIVGNFGASGNINFNLEGGFNPRGIFIPESGFCEPAQAPGVPVPSDERSRLEVLQTSTNPLTGQADLELFLFNNVGACTSKVQRNNVPVTFDESSAQGSQFTKATIDNSTYEFQSGNGNSANIVGQFGSAGQVIFNDQESGNDADRNYKAAANKFCGQLSWIGYGSTTDLEFKQADQNKDPIPITVRLSYYDSGGKCVQYTVQKKLQNPDQVGTASLRWDGEQIKDVSAQSSLVLSKRAGDNTNRLYVKANDDCGGGTVVVLDTPKGNDGTLYKLSKASGSPGGSIPKIIKDAFPGCEVDDSWRVKITGKFGEASNPTNPDPKDPNNPGENEDNCYTLGSTGLEWFFCAVLAGIDKAVKEFYEEVEDQLCVKAGISTTAGGTDDTGQAINPCGKDSGNYLNEDTKAIWSAVRVIATSLLVIAMLVMVIGTAIRGNNV